MKNFLDKSKILIMGLLVGIMGIIIEFIFFNLHRFSSEVHEFFIRIVLFGIIFTFSLVLQYYSNYSRQQIQSNEKFEIEFYNENVAQRLLGYARYKIIIFGLICGILVVIIELLIFGSHEFPHEVHETLIFIMTLGTTFSLSAVFQYYSRQQIKPIQKLIESEYNLGERVKELTCLYGLSKLVENPEISQEAILQGTLDLILPAWQFPEITCARIFFDNKEFKTSNFKETEWKLSSSVIVNEKVMMIEVYYLEDKPFLKEEERLLDDLGKRLKNFFEIKVTMQKLTESNKKFKIFTEQSLTGIGILQDDHYLYVNQQFAKIFGYSVEEILNWEFGGYLKTVHLEDLEFVKNQAEKKQKGIENVINRYEFRGIKKRGEIIWLEIFSKSFIYEEKNADLISLIDITNRKQMAQKLKESEEKFRTIAEQSSAGFIIIQNSQIIYLNNAVSKVFGYSSEELKNISIIDIFKFVHPEDRAIAVQRFNKREEGVLGDMTSDPFRIITRSGEIKWIEVYSKMFQFQEKNTIFATIVDITKERMAEVELQKLNLLKSEFLRRASHELKTPLISIKGYSDLILSLYTDQLGSEIISYLNEISHGCERLQYIINDLLKSSRLESIKLKSNLQKEDLPFLIKYCVNGMESLAKKRKQSIELNIHDQLYVNIEKEEIHAVLSNLLSNAIKYTPPNGKIEVKTDLKDDLVVISVTDNGIGFTEEQRKIVFKQFGKIERFGQGLDLEIDGTGLGLYISKRIVESHGGKIWMESEGKNMGASFYFTLPTVK
ncbi:MAG: Signal transduction histidine kinase [Candidatus Lokiarchaeum sp. GC14_75]|nr:MAG: Signal transduction histidine kinase [Candidatus Lokiarchaeum sp. GC14_75]